MQLNSYDEMCTFLGNDNCIMTAAWLIAIIRCHWLQDKKNPDILIVWENIS